MSRFRWFAFALAFVAAQAANASINLEFRPVAQTVNLGSNFDVGLYAVSDNASNQSISSIDVILNWDPTVISISGLNNNGPYGWLASNFPNDSSADGLNAPYTPVPGNDGTAYYRSFRNFSNPAFATPAGLLVTTFQFGAIALTSSTNLSILPAFGSFTRSFVVDGFVAGQEVTGSLGQAKITVVPEPATLVLCGLVVAPLLIRRRS